jgi:hypothetical protein
MELKRVVNQVETLVPEYENKDVLEIIRKLGPYDYGTPTDDGV